MALKCLALNDTRTGEWELLCRLPLAHGTQKERKGRDRVGNAATAGDVPACAGSDPEREATTSDVV